MQYEASNPGGYEPAQTGVTYRALGMQSNADATDLLVNSAVDGMSLHLAPGDFITGTVTIVSGTLVGVLGYPRIPHAGAVE